MDYLNTPTNQGTSVSDVPQHIAFIMDGNGRWATKRFLPRVAGHIKGVDAVKKMVQSCLDLGVKYLTFFAFSSENWNRPADEVSLLMNLFVTALEREIDKMHEKGVRLKVVGDTSRFSENLQSVIAKAEQKTSDNKSINMTICANYGGRWDIVQAVEKMVSAHPGTTHFSEAQLSEHLSMSYAPEPDLFIRTGGEERVSNFLLWQLAYTELYFTDTYWPDFDAEALDMAIASFRKRERRFGRTSEQLLKNASC